MQKKNARKRSGHQKATIAWFNHLVMVRLKKWGLLSNGIKIEWTDEKKNPLQVAVPAQKEKNPALNDFQYPEGIVDEVDLWSEFFSKHLSESFLPFHFGGQYIQTPFLAKHYLLFSCQSEEDRERLKKKVETHWLINKDRRKRESLLLGAVSQTERDEDEKEDKNHQRKAKGGPGGRRGKAGAGATQEAHGAGHHSHPRGPGSEAQGGGGRSAPVDGGSDCHSPVQGVGVGRTLPKVVFLLAPYFDQQSRSKADRLASEAAAWLFQTQGLEVFCPTTLTCAYTFGCSLSTRLRLNRENQFKALSELVLENAEALYLLRSEEGRLCPTTDAVLSVFRRFHPAGAVFRVEKEKGEYRLIRLD